MENTIDRLQMGPSRLIIDLEPMSPESPTQNLSLQVPTENGIQNVDCMLELQPNGKYQLYIGDGQYNVSESAFELANQTMQHVSVDSLEFSIKPTIAVRENKLVVLVSANMPKKLAA